jgi:4-carboxymuconolactone decarboxylase/3-oxoadipate enol-lactonase/4-carboxymuconolactone decarboxylase
MIALGHWDIFKLHARSALDAGVSADEIKEVIVQQTIYCGVPAGNIAMQRMQEVLTEGKKPAQ